VPAADLVSLSQVKSFLGEDTALVDVELQTLLSAASLKIRRHVDPIEDTVYADELYDGSGKLWVALRHWPLAAATVAAPRVVELDGQDISADCKWEDASGRLYYAGAFTAGVQNVSVTYAAGYGAIVPEDLQAACLMLVKFYAKSDLLARSIFFEGGGGMGAERAMPMQVREILESYPSYRR
jgi:hypothetical protein